MPSGPKKRRAAAKKKKGLSVIVEETRKIEDEPITEMEQKQEVNPADLSGNGIADNSDDETFCDVEDGLSESEKGDKKRIELIKQVIVKNKKSVEELLKEVRKFEESLLLSLDELNAIDA